MYEETSSMQSLRTTMHHRCKLLFQAKMHLDNQLWLWSSPIQQLLGDYCQKQSIIIQASISMQSVVKWQLLKVCPLARPWRTVVPHQWNQAHYSNGYLSSFQAFFEITWIRAAVFVSKVTESLLWLTTGSYCSNSLIVILSPALLDISIGVVSSLQRIMLPLPWKLPQAAVIKRGNHLF